jgi:cytidylate kinase
MATGFLHALYCLRREEHEGDDERKVMNSATLIKQYLKKRKGTEDDLGRLPFVTISRQAGSGSRELADELIRQMRGTPLTREEFDWEIFDQELCQIIADDTKLEDSLHQLLSEDYHSELHELVSDLVSGTARQYHTYKSIFGIVRALGLVGNVIIIGRGSAYVCKDMPLGIHIRLVGSEEKRVEKLSRLMNLDLDDAVKKVRDLEKGRARLVRDFFDKDINDPVNYNAVFNIDILSIAEIAGLTVEMLKQRVIRYAA